MLRTKQVYDSFSFGLLLNYMSQFLWKHVVQHSLYKFHKSYITDTCSKCMCIYIYDIYHVHHLYLSMTIYNVNCNFY